MSYLQIQLEVEGQDVESHAQVLRRLADHLETDHAPVTPALVKDFTGDIVGQWQTVVGTGVPWR